MSERYSFSELVMLDALGEITEADAERLHQQLSIDSALAAEHAAVVESVERLTLEANSSFRGLNESGVVGEIVQGVDSNEERSYQLAPEMRNRLESERRRVFRAAKVTRLPVLGSSERAALEESGRRTGNENPRKSPGAPQLFWRSAITWAAAAACALLGFLLYWSGSGGFRTNDKAFALAPQTETAFTKPLLVWNNRQNQQYDVWILPEEGAVESAPPLYTAKHVQSPLPFSELKAANGEQGKGLKPGGSYRLLVCLADAGRIAGKAVPFKVSPDATNTRPKPANAQKAMETAQKLRQEGRPGDALSVLESLPSDEARPAEFQTLEEALRRTLGRSARN